MPKLSQPAEPKKNGKAKVAIKDGERKIKYPEIKAVLYIANSDKGAITADLARKLLGWETEKDFAARLMKANPDLKEDMCVFGDDFILKDENGDKVRTWENQGNRPFDENVCRAYAQDILTRKWADSRNGSAMSINGESIVLTATGRIDSGQHRLIAIVLAAQMWAKNPKRWDKWEAEPSIEGIIVAGVSENPAVTQTLDNVKPRLLDDVLCTSHTFADLKNPADKREVAKMLTKAIESAWERMGAGGEKGNKTYQTHSASLDFLARHKRLEKYVKHIYEENKNRSISLLKLSPGEMAACCWLMASGKSDGDWYRNQNPPSEKGLNFDNEGRAMQFFVELVHAARNKGAGKTAAVPCTVVIEALGNLADDDTGMGGRKVEKLAILSRAWNWWNKQEPDAIIPPDVVDLKYHKDEMGMVHLMPDEDGYLNWFGGCDIGERVKQGKTAAPADAGEDPADESDMEERKDAAKRATDAETQKALDEKKAKLAANRKKREETGQPNGTGAVPTPKIGK